MALGITTTVDNKVNIGPLNEHKVYTLEFAPDDSYPTGGTTGFQAYVNAAFAATHGTSNNIEVFGVLPLETDNHHVEYLKGTDALKVYVPAGTEVPNATDLTGVKALFKVLVYGQ